ncbi:hypothetical protein NDU88_008535 [Pleurodeles waltl]|uniref:Uncharacterized protein n=1 Tax=Pleurodeles waltl TaxID=8319 RepID=A0AAV7RXY7_PLEWA|nr:hypothetical protein NDU88_008535 [Pleurodeles waltl]
MLGRTVRTRIPTWENTASHVQQATDPDELAEMDRTKKPKLKEYADRRWRAQQSTVRKGDWVLVRQEQKRKSDSRNYTIREFKMGSCGFRHANTAGLQFVFVLDKTFQCVKQYSQITTPPSFEARSNSGPGALGALGLPIIAVGEGYNGAMEKSTGGSKAMSRGSGVEFCEIDMQHQEQAAPERREVARYPQGPEESQKVSRQAQPGRSCGPPSPVGRPPKRWGYGTSTRNNDGETCSASSPPTGQEAPQNRRRGTPTMKAGRSPRSTQAVSGPVGATR